MTPSEERLRAEMVARRKLASAWDRVVSLVNARRVRTEDGVRAHNHGTADADPLVGLLLLVDELSRFADELQAGLTEV